MLFGIHFQFPETLEVFKVVGETLYFAFGSINSCHDLCLPLPASAVLLDVLIITHGYDNKQVHQDIPAFLLSVVHFLLCGKDDKCCSKKLSIGFDDVMG